MNKFLIKLISEEKVKLVESSKDISLAYLYKSVKSLLSAKTLVNIENLDDAIALTYYSMYYSVLALLFRIGIKSENHTGSIILLKEIFDLDVSELQKAKKDRVDKQYYVDFNTTKKYTTIMSYPTTENNKPPNNFPYQGRIVDGTYMFTPLPVMMIFMFIAGLLSVTTYNLRMQSTQDYVPNEIRARFNGTFQTLTTAGGAICGLIAGALAEFIYIPYVILGGAVIIVIAVFAILVRGRKEVKRIYNHEYR